MFRLQGSACQALGRPARACYYCPPSPAQQQCVTADATPMYVSRAAQPYATVPSLGVKPRLPTRTSTKAPEGTCPFWCVSPLISPHAPFPVKSPVMLYAHVVPHSSVYCTQQGAATGTHGVVQFYRCTARCDGTKKLHLSALRAAASGCADSWTLHVPLPCRLPCCQVCDNANGTQQLCPQITSQPPWLTNAAHETWRHSAACNVACSLQPAFPHRSCTPGHIPTTAGRNAHSQRTHHAPESKVKCNNPWGRDPRLPSTCMNMKQLPLLRPMRCRGQRTRH